MVVQEKEREFMELVAQIPEHERFEVMAEMLYYFDQNCDHTCHTTTKALE